MFAVGSDYHGSWSSRAVVGSCTRPGSRPDADGCGAGRLLLGSIRYAAPMFMACREPEAIGYTTINRRGFNTRGEYTPDARLFPLGMSYMGLRQPPWTQFRIVDGTFEVRSAHGFPKHKEWLLHNAAASSFISATSPTARSSLCSDTTIPAPGVFEAKYGTLTAGVRFIKMDLWTIRRSRVVHRPNTTLWSSTDRSADHPQRSRRDRVSTRTQSMLNPSESWMRPHLQERTYFDAADAASGIAARYT